MPKGPNLANDQQGRIKIPVLPDLFKAKGVRHLNMLCLANTEKKRVPLLQRGVNILSEIWSILSFYNMKSSQQLNSHGSPFFYHMFESRIFECYHHTLSISPLPSRLMRDILRFIFFICRHENIFFHGFCLQFRFATA